MITISRNMNRSRSYWIQNQFAFHSGSLMDTTKKKRFVVLSEYKRSEFIVTCHETPWISIFFITIFFIVFQTVYLFFICGYWCKYLYCCFSNCTCLFTQDNQISIAEDEKRKDEELDRQALLAEQRREEERLLQEEQQREKMVKIKAVEGKISDLFWWTQIWF